MNAINRYLLFLAAAPLCAAAAPADPYTRDADISGSVLDVEYTQRADGLYEYVYTLRAPATNLDAVGELYIDLRCEVEFPPAVFPPPPEKQSYFGNRAAEGTISPSVIGADYGAAASFGIFTHGHAYWGFTVTPGTENPGMRLISSAAPGLRNYVLNPEWNTDPELWNYPRDPDPALPKRSDFTVRGMIAGPGCPGVTPPVEEPRYAGTPHKAEAENINELLTYITPLQNRLQTEHDSVTFTIVYSPDIDASTFKAEPGWLRHLLTPSPGTRETVQIPMRGKKQKFMLEVHPLGTAAVRKHDELDHSTKDRDDFEIRAVTPEAGNEKK